MNETEIKQLVEENPELAQVVTHTPFTPAMHISAAIIAKGGTVEEAKAAVAAAGL
jgi:ABC-type proline/glycine betaine transport system substrate-binding protein